MRTLPGSGRPSKKRLISSSEHHSNVSRKHPSINNDVPVFVENRVPAEPAAGVNKKRKCTFCGDSSHARWDACLTKGKASEIGGVTIEPTRKSYRDFHDNLQSTTHYLAQHIDINKDVVIYDKIPRKCNHVIVHMVKRTLQLELLGSNATSMTEYHKKIFETRALLEWISKMSNYKKVHQHRIFHHLERTTELNVGLN
eukprot:scaffold5900_cov60-Attheya_sp.AAC.2